jgi:hypothetical protein
VLHVLRVRKGSDDDLPVEGVPQSDDGPQPWTEEFQVMVTTWASPVWPAVKESYKELGTGARRGFLPQSFLEHLTDEDIITVA